MWFGKCDGLTNQIKSGEQNLCIMELVEKYNDRGSLGLDEHTLCWVENWLDG